MTKRGKLLDELSERFDFDSPIEVYAQLREELGCQEDKPKTEAHAGTYAECCMEITVAVKKAIRTSGLSREQVVDAVNEFFQFSKTSEPGERLLTINMLNSYLCRPESYTMPIPYLHAIQQITGSLEPLIVQAELEGAQIITGDEIRKLTLGKIDDAINELQRLKKTFRQGSNK